MSISSPASKIYLAFFLVTVFWLWQRNISSWVVGGNSGGKCSQVWVYSCDFSLQWISACSEGSSLFQQLYSEIVPHPPSLVKPSQASFLYKSHLNQTISTFWLKRLCLKRKPFQVLKQMFCFFQTAAKKQSIYTEHVWAKAEDCDSSIWGAGCYNVGNSIIPNWK